MDNIIDYIKNSVSKDVIKAYIKYIEDHETIYCSRRVVEVEPGEYLSSKPMIWILEKLLECATVSSLECTTVDLFEKGDEDGE